MPAEPLNNRVDEELESESPREFGPTELLVRRPIWADIMVLVSLGAIFYMIVQVGEEFTGPRVTTQIDLSPSALPKYMMFSVFRVFAAYALSLIFTLVYGYVAARNRRAERVMVPLLDVLQSVPVLTFMPGLMLAFSALFPRSNIGLELVSIILIFTGQVWNMTFSFYHSLQAIPRELYDAARVYRFSWLRRFTRVELPFAALPLAWNSMVGMAGGWFFLTICESFRLGEMDFRLPGIGSYMTTAIGVRDFRAMTYGVLAMTLAIIVIDRLIWRPVLAWAQKFKYEETAPEEPAGSLVLDLLRASRVNELALRAAGGLERVGYAARRYTRTIEDDLAPRLRVAERIGFYLLKAVYLAAAAAAIVAVLWGAWLLLGLVAKVTLADWLLIGRGAGLSLLRVVAALVLATAWTVPVGILIGTNPRLCARMQSVIQVVASFPAPMLYPLVLLGLQWAGIALGVGSIFLLMLGTQWYILFNAIAGSMGIPEELREASRIYKIRGRQLWNRLYLPAVLTSLVTGWIAAAGGAWNATIVAEYVPLGDTIFATEGLGAIISMATSQKQFHILAASAMTMALLVVMINRFVWRRIFTFAVERYSLSQ